MKFLHTSDWHVGKTLKGRSRLDEQRAVLGEIVRIAREEAVDAVLVAGDLYETSAPTAAAQQLVVRALLALRRNRRRGHRYRREPRPRRDVRRVPAADGAAGIQLSGGPRPAADGGVVSFDARSTGERVNVAVLPFLSQRYAVTRRRTARRDAGRNAATTTSGCATCSTRSRPGSPRMRST